MRSSKYLLESWESSLYFWYSISSQIPNRITQDLNFLTVAHTQGSINVDARIFSLEVLLLDLSVTTRCIASRVYAPIHNLGTLRQILFSIKFPIKILSKFAIMADFFFLQTLGASHLKLRWFTFLNKSSRCCCWHHAFLLNPLKFDGIASSYSALHHTMCIIS
jgi:hypothetical protein